MELKSLELENWKCFREKIHLNFNTIEILSMPNGVGKTSVFQAISYAIWGKVNGKLESYQNYEGQTDIILNFIDSGDEYRIERSFPKTKAILYKNDTEFKKGIREIFEWMDEKYNYSFTKRIWFSGDIADNEILDFNFFKKEILTDILKEAQTLISYYNSESTSLTKLIDSTHIIETRKIEEIKNDIKNIKGNLKERTNVSDVAYNNALQTKQAVEEIKKYSPSSLIQSDVIRSWESINLDSCKNQLKIEEAKDYGIGLNPSTINNVIDINNNNNKCMCCGGSWDDTKAKQLQHYLETRNDDYIQQLKQQISLKESLKEEDIIKSKDYYKLKSIIDSNPNYEEVIKKYNKENDLLWDKLDSYQNELNVAEQQIENAKKLDEYKKKKNDIKDKITVLKQYMNEATNYYTNKLLESSSSILEQLDGDYTGVTVEDNNICVIAKQKKLYVTQLSKGERTLVAFSIILALRDIFATDLPLIFDESFAGLDENHEHAIMEYIRKSKVQVFVITHSNRWNENIFYLDNSTIRVSWE